ncbi:hypothetical protein [Paenibacillus sp. SYP-B4298]|uniref:hypothetical protein n=1 Tax=Paenibacillus sp. SYP-B4298 TaxID=2996034 RepID=UPI0022DD1F85|nr:hypothetical protein [Paenibacillus sp. SYP-B4298]
MKHWRGALHLLRFELKRDWPSFIFNILFYTYLAIILTPFVDESTVYYQRLSWMVNFLYLSLLPCMGFALNRTIFRYWQDDLYSRKVAMWRTMPIAIGEIVWARLLHLKLMTGIGILYYFGLHYVALDQLWNTVPHPVVYMGQVIVWYAYALAMGVTLVYWEICYSGKTFVIISFVYTLIFVGIAVMLQRMGIDVNTFIMGQMNGSGWWIMLLASVVVAAAAIVSGAALMTAKLKKRPVR